MAHFLAVTSAENAYWFNLCTWYSQLPQATASSPSARCLFQPLVVLAHGLLLCTSGTVPRSFQHSQGELRPRRSRRPAWRSRTQVRVLEGVPKGKAGEDDVEQRPCAALLEVASAVLRRELAPCVQDVVPAATEQALQAIRSATCEPGSYDLPDGAYPATRTAQRWRGSTVAVAGA